jgi:hypothetical protein
MQIELGLEITEYAKKEVASGVTPQKAFAMLVNQCLKRDAGWKEFYTERMNQVDNGSGAEFTVGRAEEESVF